MDQCTPIQCIKNPPAAGPITAPICQTELLHVAAFGYIFLGTNKENNEKNGRPQKSAHNSTNKNEEINRVQNSISG